jgi:hypothetical protein
LGPLCNRPNLSIIRKGIKINHFLNKLGNRLITPRIRYCLHFQEYRSAQIWGLEFSPWFDNPSFHISRVFQFLSHLCMFSFVLSWVSSSFFSSVDDPPNKFSVDLLLSRVCLGMVSLGEFLNYFLFLQSLLGCVIHVFIIIPVASCILTTYIIFITYIMALFTIFSQLGIWDTCIFLRGSQENVLPDLDR